MNNQEFLDFSDILSHENELLNFNDFDFIDVISSSKIPGEIEVYDLVVDKNRNYVTENLGIVHNGGKRAGAGTVALPIWHNDIFDFLDMQTEHGDARLKSYDVFPQVTVPSLFMQRDKENGTWTTFCPYEVKTKLNIDIRGLYGEAFNTEYLKIEAAFLAGKLKVAKTYKARDIIKTIMRTQFETGLPYIAFTDTINAVNPNAYHKDSIGITNVNLCVESFSSIKPDVLGHVCNLCSINLSNINSLEELGTVSRIATKMLDYGIELTSNPDDITTVHNKTFRTIGIGQMGMHDYLAKNWLNFNDLTEIRELSECIEYNAALESVELAKKYGTFTAYTESRWANGEMTAMFEKNSSGKYDWKFLQDQINLYGIRNSQLTSPAPTTSCHSLDDEIVTSNGITTMGKILLDEGYSVDKLVTMEPQWIELSTGVDVPDTFNDIDTVSRIWWNGIQETIAITFEDGVTYQFTPNHKLLVRDNGIDLWVMCKDITENMEIVDSTMTRSLTGE